MSRGLLQNGNIRVLASTSMVTGIYVSMLNTIFQPFVLGLGFSITVLSLLIAVGARPFGLASSISQPFAGRLSDIIGRKPMIVAGSAVGILSMVSLLEAALTHSISLLSVGYLLFGLSLIGSPATQASIAESVSMDPGRVNIAFSVVFFFTQLPGAFIPFTAGYLTGTFGYAAIFGAAAFLESANLIVLATMVRETRLKAQAETNRIRLGKFSLKEMFRIPPGFLRIFTPFAMDAVSFGICGPIIYGMWEQTFGLTQGDIGLVQGVLSVSIVASQYPATKLMLKVGIRQTLVLSEALSVLILAGWLLTPSLPAFVFLAIIFGFSVAAWVPSISSLIMSTAPVEERGSLSGKLSAFRGIASAPAPLLGGLIFSAYGYYVPVLLSFVGIAITTVALFKLLPRV